MTASLSDTPESGASMAVMTPGSHARTKTARTPGLWAAWAVLITMGGTSVTLNIWDATHAAHLFWLIAGLRGTAPVGAAMGLSEVGARYDGGKVFRGLCFAVMAGAMALSMSAIAAVLRPGSDPWAAWLFGVVLDAAALICLHVVLSARSRKADAEAEREAERDAVAEATSRAAQALSELAAARETLTAERDQVRAELGVQLDAMRTELATANGALEALRAKRVPPRKSRRASARKPAATPGRNQVPVPVPEPATATAGTSGPADMPDLDTEARILALIEQGHSASQAGIMAGKSDSYGRYVARLARAAQKEPAGDERTAGDVK